MKFKMLKLSGLLALLVSACFFTSCNKEDILESSDEFVEESLFVMERSGSIGASGCFELIFPITVAFEDGTTAEVNDYDELKETIRTYKENNPDATEKPTFVYPLEVLAEDGSIITVEDKTELKALKKECNFRSNNSRNHRARDLCFDLVFPINIVLPDSTLVEVNSKREAKQLVRQYKKDNPDATEFPTVVFPLEVELEDGTIVVVNSIDELIALRASCDD